jgi:hypothetical protein
LSSCNFVQCIIEQNLIRLISPCRPTLEDSFKVYFVFFGVVIHFLEILEGCNNFLKYKQKRKFLKPGHIVLGRTVAHGFQALAWSSSTMAQPARASQHFRVRAERGHHVHGHRGGAAGTGSPAVAG